MKPSLGTWPGSDIIPVNYEQDTCGPMARNIQDVELLHRIVSGIDEKSDISSRTLRVGYLGKFNQISIPFRMVFFSRSITTWFSFSSNSFESFTIDNIDRFKQ